jgi:hypothetical protein
MKKVLKSTCMLAASSLLLASCKKFEELNKNPLAASADQVQVEYFINNSIIGAQMDPHIAERVFVLYWQVGGHQSFQGNTINVGGYNDGWSSDYYGGGYMSGWLNSANTAVQVAEEKIAAGNTKSYTNNLLQVARIWRVYLMSEMTDNFGPIPINGFQGVNPEFASVKDVYYFMLSELKDASTKLDVAVVNPDDVKKQDPAYSYDYNKWRRYANSMRLRLAMRLSEVDAAKAKSEFEAAAAGDLLIASDQTFQVAEKGGWDALTGDMTREWNAGLMTSTILNLGINLGGIKSEDQLSADFDASIKPADYIGLKLEDHFATNTNDPSAGYWLDGLPHAIDPRLYKTFIIPGDFNNPNFNSYPSWDNTARTLTGNLTDGTPANNVVKTINAKYTYNAFAMGSWGPKGTKNGVRAFNGTIPRLGHQFRNSSNKRIFFAPWETYFLLAEAAVKGWATPVSGQVAYEKGIEASFAYWGLTGFLGSYLTSQEYNRAGTSVSWSHTAEPPASHAMNFINGYTNAAGVANILYPKNDLYKNGTVKNDLLTKIITQKFIAQTPWLPLETWNDHRRLGLPFFENPAIEAPLPNLPALTAANYMTSNVKFFPQRLRYPSGLKNSNAKGYDQAVALLGGPDEILTPLWWARH